MEPTRAEINAALNVLTTWGGLRDRNLDAYAIVWKMLSAAKERAPSAGLTIAQDGFSLCEDEGCPQHGTPHVCIDSTRRNTDRS